jgi:UDP-glucuronate 4-epimerase
MKHCLLHNFLSTALAGLALTLTSFSLFAFNLAQHEYSSGYRRQTDVRLTSRQTFENSTILITGVAGFIGYSLASKLAQDPSVAVIGVDNFNAYYDVRLKYARADRLSPFPNVRIIEGDVCNVAMMEDLVRANNFTHVVHLAAQAGVRHSLEKPFNYIRENVQCFLAVLETLRTVKSGLARSPVFVYASSSSVYGSNTPPFVENDRVDMPTNLYSVTKRTNELMAVAYYHLFGIVSVGLRFFTVYGPWGRPDMAPYLFTDSISKGENITVFNKGQMSRDFTYIDDIVDGILLAMKHQPVKPAVFNLGNNRAESVFKLIRIIEQTLATKARIVFKPSRTEIPATYASLTHSERLLGYRPQTNLQQGMQSFINWHSLFTWSRPPCASECSQENSCVRSSLDEVAQHSTKATDGCNIVVYSVHLGSTPYNPPPIPQSSENATTEHPRTCYLIFTNVQLEQDGDNLHWLSIIVGDGLGQPLWWDARRMSRIFKLAPQSFFSSSVNVAIYQDAKLELALSPHALSTYLHDSTGRRAFLCAVRHPVRSSPYEERIAIEQAKIVRPNITFTTRLMDHQMHKYEIYQQSSNVSLANMIDGALLIHDLKHPCGQRFRCVWAKEYFTNADRDQLSFAFALGASAKEAGFILDANQEWCPAICNMSGHTGYVRILPNADHWDHTSVIAKYFKDGIH